MKWCFISNFDGDSCLSLTRAFASDSLKEEFLTYEMRNLSIIRCILFPSASWKCLLCNSFISGKREGDKNKLALCGGWRLADLCEEFFGWEDVM